MAKYTATVAGTRDELAAYIKEHALGMGMTITLEEEESGTADSVKYWLGTFERYAYMGGNRSSLTAVLLEHSGAVDVIATASGASNGMFLKFNTWSEASFLEDFIKLIDWYRDGRA